MSLRKMYNGDKLTRAGYEQAFAEVRADHRSLDAWTVQQYITSDPSNAEFLWQELYALTIESLTVAVTKKFPSVYVPRYVYLHPLTQPIGRYIQKLDVLKEMSALVPKNLIPELQSFTWIFGVCINCQETDHHPSLGVYPPLVALALQYFDTRHRPTHIALEQFINNHPALQRDCLHIYGLCKRCNIPCHTCGTRIQFPYLDIDTLPGYLEEGVCPDCGNGSITKLPCPKPSGKELRLYRSKLISFGKE